MTTLLPLGGYAVLGVAMGALHLGLLRLNTDLYLGDRGWWQPVALHFARMAAVVVGFVAVATGGAGAVLAAFAGFLLARALLIRPLAGRHG
ncbi:MAG TPA: ATP synthase subunit I [Stellaceae bacterium]|nr:ATP synthase subunit I [Stellaceae bacterium]